MPLVEAEHARQASQQPKRRGHPKTTVVTGYRIGDDSTEHTARGDKMGGLGRHYSTSEDKPARGHSLVQGLYVLLGKRCLLAPNLYQQEAVCERAEMTFPSKIHLMRELIRSLSQLLTPSRPYCWTRGTPASTSGVLHGNVSFS